MFKNNEFMCVVHYAHDAQGSGASKEDAKPIVSGEMFKVPEGVVVTDAAVIIDVAVAGSTALEVGDGDDADAYVAAADVTLGAAGVNEGAGALLNGKKYAADDTIDLAVTGASSAGEFQVVVRGYRV